MKIEKAVWTTTEDQVHVSVPLSKIDKENRKVSGFATLDNVDSQKDIVTASASTKAFTRFRGNLREMHDSKIAAGHLVQFKEDVFFDPETEKMYNGIFVTAYVSKGAPNTWEKVLDGTLTGFSIGGNILDADTEFDKAAGTSVRKVTDYELVELSLVDNPANHLANVFSIEKSATGMMMKGMTAEVHVKNVFWCPVDEIAKCTSEEQADCSICGGGMAKIDWIEDGNDIQDKVKGVVTKFLGQTQELESENGEGGVDMTVKKNDEPAVEVEETVNSDETTELEKDAVVDEPVATDEPDLVKMISDLQAAIEHTLEKAENATTETLTRVDEQIETISKSFKEQFETLDEKFTELTKSVAELKGLSEAMGKSLEVLEGDTAIKKSGDLESTESLTKVKDKKDTWNGAFVGVENL